MASNKKKKKGQQKPAQGASAQTAPVAAKQKASQEKQAAPEPKKKGLFKSKADKDKDNKAAAKKGAASKSKASKKAKNAKPTFLGRIKNYFTAVKTEMRRVVWPSKQELVNYSVAVVVSLIVVGVVIAVLDLVIGEGLVLFAGLRG